jgi:hypothetical protein
VLDSARHPIVPRKSASRAGSAFPWRPPSITNVARSVYFPDPDGNRLLRHVENGFETMVAVGLRCAILDMETGESEEVDRVLA